MKGSIMRKGIFLSAIAVIIVLLVVQWRGERSETQAFLSEARPRILPDQGDILLNDDTFSGGFMEIHDFREEFYGRTISLSGIVMTQDTLNPGEFLVGRNTMWCCEEDAYFTGFLAYFEGTPPGVGEKIALEGVLEQRAYRSAETGATITLPAIRANKIRHDPTVQVFIRPAF